MNILAWKDARERFRITVNTAKANEIVVRLSDNQKMVFKEVESGTFHYKLSSQMNSTKKNVISYSFFTLVEANK